MALRIVRDSVLGTVNLDTLEASLNTKNAEMKSALRGADSLETRALHFERNGAQIRQSLERSRANYPDRFPALLESCRVRGDFILPEACSIVVRGARLCVEG